MPDHNIRLFHIGPQKGATTWIYECLKNHPDIRTSARDTIHYYDMNFAKGRAWYDAQFTHGTGTCFFDPTFTYLRAPNAAARIKADFPDAKIMVNVRNPIDRAFDHYWHEKKKGAITVPFKDAITNYDWFQTWIEPGLYAARLKPFVDAFGVENILPIIMDDIRKNPTDVLDRIYQFAGISNVPLPPKATRIINGTGARQNIIHRTFYKMGNILTHGHASESAFWRQMGGIETQSDAITPQMRADLLDIFMPDIVELEQMFNLNLDGWKR